MKLKLLFLLALICCITIPGVFSANIRGVVYDHSYNPILKVVVTINTTPEQTKISTTGAYYFVVPAGSYLISATLTKNNITKEVAEQELTVSDSDDIVKDLLLFDSIDLDKAFSESWWTLTQQFIKDNVEIFVIILLIVVVVVCVVLGISVYRRRALRAPLSQSESVMAAPLSVPDGLLTTPDSGVTDVTNVNIELTHLAEQKTHQSDTTVLIAAPVTVPDNRSNDDIMQERILHLLSVSSGVIQQKELRKEFPVSEAKISMVLSQMVSAGLIKKTRKGRVNYLQLIGIIKKP